MMAGPGGRGQRERDEREKETIPLICVYLKAEGILELTRDVEDGMSVAKEVESFVVESEESGWMVLMWEGKRKTRHGRGRVNLC